LIGITGSPSGSLGGTKTNVYTSDYATFNTAASESFNFGLATITPTLSNGPGSFLSSFASNVNGQFSAESTGFKPNVPEPASAVLIGIGALALGVSASKRRQRVTR
jgi:hypothetical protein